MNEAREIVKYACEYDIRLVEQNGDLLVNAPKGKVSFELRERLIKYKRKILEVLMELKNYSGDDWVDVKDELLAVKSIVTLIDDNSLRAQGRIPESYTSIATCRGCGPVFLPPSFAGNHTILACPWCFDRERGVVIPRPHCK